MRTRRGALTHLVRRRPQHLERWTASREGEAVGTYQSAKRRRCTPAFLVVTPAALALAACGSAAKPPVGQGSSTTQASAPSHASDPAGNAALAAYEGMWADFVTAGHTSDWQ